MRATLPALLCAAAAATAAYTVLAPSARRPGAPHVTRDGARPVHPPPTASTRSHSGAPSPRLTAAWRNRTYTTDCHRLAARPFKARVRKGRATAPGDGRYRRYALGVRPVLEADLTNDGRPETAVLLTCRGSPGHGVVQEVQVFTGRSRLLTLLPDVPARAGAPLPPIYDPGKPFTITRGHDLVAPMRFYAPTDSHAGGPSLHRSVTFRWNGIGFAPSGYPDLAAHPDLSHAVVTTDGLGPLRIGMSFGQVSDLLAQELLPNLAGAPRCITVAPTHLSPGVSLTFNLGDLARINIQAPSRIATSSAIRIGSSAADVERSYPHRITNAVRHRERAMIDAVADTGPDRAIAFVQGGLGERVIALRVGTRNAVLHGDRC